MIAHLLGNGPSRKEFRNDPTGDIFGCNLSDETLPLKATFILDNEVFSHILHLKINLPWPIIAHGRWRKICNRLEPSIVMLDELHRPRVSGESTGHHAAHWLLENGYTNIHLWGFDSLKDGSVTSDSHEKIANAIWTEKIVPKWIANWNKIFQDNPNTFTVH